MAEELETIDAVRRRLNRDVYYLALIDDDGAFGDIYTDVSEATEWLDAQQIGWRLCAGFSEESVWIEGGPGCIFLEIRPETGAGDATGTGTLHGFRGQSLHSKIFACCDAGRSCAQVCPQR